MSSLLHSYTNGLLVAAGLIMAIGAQNAFVLAQGLRREHHISVALICMSCDAVLIVAGIFGLAALLQSHPLAMEITRWAGVGFLTLYALQALRRALSPQILSLGDQPQRSHRAVLLSTLAVTLLNPHVYLDTMVLIGSVGAQHALPAVFALGAVSASVLWFSVLALGSARLAPLLRRPMTWRCIDLTVAAMMLAVAWSLARPALQTL
ncbi:MAG: LysE/ArgO family amino acid transporter [Halopseudomonas sp.]|uniref:LysE/ArgO family amino acid transporter n=1 Tax=Halopseudomonas sp. TaxID=2901191 RepID=UPI0030021997